MKACLVLIGVAAVALTAYPGAALTPAQQFDLARTEAASAASQWGISAQVVPVDGDRITALQGGQIKIGRNALQAVIGAADDRRVPVLIGWLMRHEVWHQVQYARGFDPGSPEPAQRRLHECDADVMASYSLFYRMIGPNPQALSDRRVGEIAGDLNGVVQSVQNLESGAAGLLSHPDGPTRQHAVRIGTARAVHDRIAPDSQDTGSGAVKLRLARLYDIQPLEDVAAWAMRLCRLALHNEGGEESLALGDGRIQWNKSGDPPVVDYALPFRNSGPGPIRVTMQVRTAAVPRTERDAFARWVMTDARQYAFELQPGATYTVTGRLEWFATDELMPRLLFPKRPFSLFQVTQLVPASPANATAAPIIPLSADDDELKASLQAIYAGAVVQPRFRPVATNCRQEGGYESCDVLVPLPGVLSATVEREGDGSSEVDATIYEGADRTRAQAAYRNFYQRLRLIYPATRFVDRTRDDGTESVKFSPENRVEVLLSWRRRTSGEYITSLSVTPSF